MVGSLQGRSIKAESHGEAKLLTLWWPEAKCFRKHARTFYRNQTHGKGQKPDIVPKVMTHKDSARCVQKCSSLICEVFF